MINDDLWAEVEDEEQAPAQPAPSTNININSGESEQPQPKSGPRNLITNYVGYLFNRVSRKNSQGSSSKTLTPASQPEIKAAPVITPPQPAPVITQPAPLPSPVLAKPAPIPAHLSALDYKSTLVPGELDNLWGDPEPAETEEKPAQAEQPAVPPVAVIPEVSPDLWSIPELVAELPPPAPDVTGSPLPEVQSFDRDLLTVNVSAEEKFTAAPPEIKIFETDEKPVLEEEVPAELIAEIETATLADNWFAGFNETTASTPDFAASLPDVEVASLALDLDWLPSTGNSDLPDDFDVLIDADFAEPATAQQDYQFGPDSAALDSLDLPEDLESLLEEMERQAAQRAAELRAGAYKAQLSPRFKSRPGLPKEYYYEDVILQYLSYLPRYSMLKPEEEREVGRLVAEGDAHARQRLIEANLRLVYWVARRYIKHCNQLDLADLVQEGNLGLIRAVDKFDYTLGYKFSTYATWWIRQALSRAIADKDRSIRLPVHINESLARFEKVSRQLSFELGREPNVADLTQALNLPEEKVRQLMSLSAHPISLDQPIDNDDDETTRPGYMGRTEAALALGVSRIEFEQFLNHADEEGEIGLISLLELTEDPKADDPEKQAAEISMRAAVQKALSQLPERERKIIELRFGLDQDGGGQPRTLEEVGQYLGVTRERIRQIEAKVFRKLQHPRIALNLKGFIEVNRSAKREPTGTSESNAQPPVKKRWEL
ncbi:MAG TPA: sigma-70 family RNA polymerase sigma factor [Chloroflexia bacterium]|nr:sigma-70 family RNA polymerase sigma factor [Chloroflexia bacterium]